MRIRYEIAIGLFALIILFMVGKIALQMLLTTGLDRICPNCGATVIRASSPRRFTDLPYRIFFMRPYRCMACEHRFFSFRQRDARNPALQPRRATAQNTGEPSRNGA